MGKKEKGVEVAFLFLIIASVKGGEREKIVSCEGKGKEGGEKFVPGGKEKEKEKQ